MIPHSISPGLRLRGVAALFAAALIAGCDDGARASRSRATPLPERTADPRVLLRLGVATDADQRLLHLATQPLVDYLSERTGFRFEYRMGRSSERAEVEVTTQDLTAYVEERVVEIAPLGALSYCIAERRFAAVPLVRRRNDDGEPTERTLFFVREESPVRGLRDLAGRSLALGPSHSTHGHLVALHELDEAQIDLGTLRRVENASAEEAVVDAVRGGRFDAGAIAESALPAPPASLGLRVVHRSAPLPSSPIVARGDLPETIRRALREALLELPPQDDLDRAFRNGFAPVSPSDYEPFRRMLDAQGGRCATRCHDRVRFREDD